MIGLFKYLKGCHTEEGQDLFSIIPDMQQWAQVKGSQILVEYQEKHPVRDVRQWNQLPQELVRAPTLEAFKKNLDNHLADML